MARASSRRSSSAAGATSPVDGALSALFERILGAAAPRPGGFCVSGLRGVMRIAFRNVALTLALGLAVAGTTSCGRPPRITGPDGGADEPRITGPDGGVGVRGIRGKVRWQWQLSGVLDLSIDADVFDVDLFDVAQEAIASLQAAGRYVICYFSAGSREAWRPDVSSLPAEAVGEPLSGWPDEQWLDVRHPAVRALAVTRLEHAQSRGCDAVEPDNVDAYQNSSGFPLTDSDQLAFNRFLAAQAHARGLAIALKNDVEQIAALEPDFDFALNEECLAFRECEMLGPFILAGKAVLHVEYAKSAQAPVLCGAPTTEGFSTLLKNLSLDAWRYECP